MKEQKVTILQYWDYQLQNKKRIQGQLNAVMQKGCM